MSRFQVQALYDFEAQGEGELSISAGEVITVVNQDVGEGWWEGQNDKGKSGLFPAGYVEMMSSSQPPSMPPPPLPADYGNDNGHMPVNNSQQQQQLSSSYPSTPQHQFNDGGWDDEWDDDEDDDASTVEHNHANNQHTKTSEHGLAIPGQELRSSSTGDVSVVGRDSRPSVKRNFNPFSTFAKSGGEDYIIGRSKVLVDTNDKVQIIGSLEEGLMWAPTQNQYHCVVSAPKKESKLRGFKSYISYQITPSFNNIVVSRRYKHFDWLHQRLQEKFAIIPIPPLPDKQISGRYEEAFIEHRRVQLQSWVDRISRHPVISQSEVWRHFITCTDEKSWKQGKRKAEKDELVGANFLLSVATPPQIFDLPFAETQIEMFGKFVKTMDDGVRNMQNVAVDQIKKHTGPYKRECQKIGNSFKTLASAFDVDKQAFCHSKHLVDAIRSTGETYDAIGMLYEEQPKNDFEPLTDVLHEYKGMLGEFPGILALHKGSAQKIKEMEKTQSGGDNPEQRMSVVSYATVAEMNHFKEEITFDFNKMMKEFLTGQITFYEKIVNQLKDSLEKYQ